MRTHDIIVAIHQTAKSSGLAGRGPESLPQYGAAAGVSHLSSRPEGPTLRDRLDGWDVDGESARDGHTPWRKLVRIELPDGVEAGPYTIAGVTINGLHSTAYSCRDGMGRSVYCYTREARVMEPGETASEAIDRAIGSGVILLVPGADGTRHEVEARVLAVSDLYGGLAPDNWVWS